MHTKLVVCFNYKFIFSKVHSSTNYVAMVACSDSGKAGLCGRNKVPHLGGRIRGVGVNTCTYALCLSPLPLSLSIFRNLPSRSFLYHCLPFAFLSPSLCPSILPLSLPLLFLPSTFLLLSPLPSFYSPLSSSASPSSLIAFPFSSCSPLIPLPYISLSSFPHVSCTMLIWKHLSQLRARQTQKLKYQNLLRSL